MAVAVVERFPKKVFLAEQKSDRLMAAKIHDSNKAMHVVAAYVPQSGFSVSEKDHF